MATVNFLYRSVKDKAFLNLRLLFRHNNIDYAIGGISKILATKSYWVKYQNSKRVKDPDILNEQKRVTDEMSLLNDYILKKFNSLNEDDVAKVVNKVWLKQTIKAYYLKSNSTEVNNSLLLMFDYYVSNKKISRSTRYIYSSVKNILELYQNHYDEIIYISEVDESFKIKLVKLMSSTNYSQNTISVYLSKIKAVCNYAGYLGIDTNRQLSKLSVSREKIDNIYLTFDDLKRIENLDLSSNRVLDNVRDLLVISCYTGQRASDFMKFKGEMIRFEDSKPYIEFTQRKTGKLMTIPLHKKVMDILSKRNGEFPKVNNNIRQYNIFLRRIGELAGLNNIMYGSIVEKAEGEGKDNKRKRTGYFKKYELMTSHIGRRSFATNFYGTIPTTFLIYITGHSTEQMFLNYIGKSNKDLAKEVFKYFE